MIQILYGCESYKMDLIKEKAQEGIEPLLKKSFDSLSEDVVEFLNTASFQEGRKVAIVTVQNLADIDLGLLERIEAIPGDFLLHIDAKSADKRKKTVKELLKIPGMVKECGRCQSEPELAKIVRFEAKGAGCTFLPAAEKLFIERCGYLKDESVSLYHVKNLILDLSDLSKDGTITQEDVLGTVPENVLYNAFSLTALLDAGKVGEVKKQAEKLKDGESISAISAMLFDFRTTYKIRLGFSRDEVGVYKDSPLLKYTPAQLLACMNVCTRTVEKVKKGEISEKDALMYAALEITRIIK